MATTVVSTTCTMDCPDTCALQVTVTDGRIHKIAAGGDHPTTNGFICDKVQRFDRRVYHPDRLLYPMRRSGPKGSGQFTRITWDNALAEIAARFRAIIAQHGAEAILPYHYGGSNGMIGDGLFDNYFFARLGASRLARTLCAAPAAEVATGMYGKMPGVAYEDYPAAKCIIVWGANPKAANIHLMPYLRQAKRNGAFIASVNPVCNFSDQEIDLHIPVYPGADLPLALAMINHWRESGLLANNFLAEHAVGAEPLLEQAAKWPVERAAQAARVSATDIRTLADRYAESAPALIRVGWGTERNLNGGQALAAMMAMPALMGKFGVRGGGYTLSNSGAAKIDTSKVFAGVGGDLPWKTRIINMSRIGQVLMDDPGDAVDPPIRALFVYNCNPLATVPDQNRVIAGFAREDVFTVVHEQVMTDTALYADIVLPSVTFLEQYELKRGYGSYIVGGVRPVIEPCGEARPNEQVFAELGRAMGFSEEPFTWDTATCMKKTSQALVMHGQSADPSVFTAGKAHAYDFPGPTPVQFGNAMPQNADRKAHLTPPGLGDRPYEYQPVEDARFPLALISPSNNKMISSQLGEFNYPELFVTIHPDDAAGRGIRERDEVRVFNDLGVVVCRATLSARIRAGVVAIPKGAWRKSSRNGQTANALSPAHVNVVAGGACYNDARVEITRTA
jgi:anaerobic selenocysteine-containing dehydrogenase